MASFIYDRFEYRTAPELAGAGRRRYPVVIVGAGPVGLAAALDLAQLGIDCVVLDDNDQVSDGSRAICWAKRTLEIFDRLGVGERMLAKGVTWKVGRIYHGERELYHFDLLPEGGHRMPAFINLQQYYVEHFLVARARELGARIDLRWKNRVTQVRHLGDGVRLEVETPEGPYRLECDWLIAADGARSAIRGALGHGFSGHAFEDKFLIVDVRMAADYPSDRRFWFRPRFDPAESVLIHRQPDDVFRIDFQLGRDADVGEARDPERALARVRRVVGPAADCRFEWCSVYTFKCARMPRFVDGHVIFAGDSAHLVSPFGARGGNGGIQDVDNLCWKLALILRGLAPSALLASYECERGRAADENIANARRTTAFMSPATPAERALRDAVLELAGAHPFARALVNSGRLSRPHDYAGLPGSEADAAAAPPAMHPGAACLDAPLPGGEGGWLLQRLGNRPCALVMAADEAEARALQAQAAALTTVPGLRTVTVDLSRGEPARLAGERYGAAAGTTCLIRPDQHVLARWPRWDPAAIADAWRGYIHHPAWEGNV